MPRNLILWAARCAFLTCFLTAENSRLPASRAQAPQPENTSDGRSARTEQLRDGANPGDEWSGNHLKMNFCWCPKGDFKMGSPRSEFGRDRDEGLALVRISQGYWLGKYEVTQADWESIMDTRPWEGQEYSQSDKRHAASYVSHDDALAFCRKLTATEQAGGRLSNGWTYTLPTEAQWEYACRAGTLTAYNFGDQPRQLNEYAWWGGLFDDGNAKRELHPHQVGTKRGNAWGLHDMHGNVWEWCLDGYHERRIGGKDPFIRDGESRVVRGGCWGTSAANCRSASRYALEPSFRYYDLGFRIVLTRSLTHDPVNMAAKPLGRDQPVLPKPLNPGAELASLQLEITLILFKKGYTDMAAAESQRMADSSLEIQQLIQKRDLEGARKMQLQLLEEARLLKKKVEELPPSP